MLDYYKTNGVRDICHAVKENDAEAIRIMAEYFISLRCVNKSSILIPAPQHTGNAEYTLEIANIVSDATGAKVCDILKRCPENPLYKVKAKGDIAIPSLYVTGRMPSIKSNVFFVDNVISTGTTFNTACKTIGINMSPLVFAVDKSK